MWAWKDSWAVVMEGQKSVHVCMEGQKSVCSKIIASVLFLFVLFSCLGLF